MWPPVKTIWSQFFHFRLSLTRLKQLGAFYCFLRVLLLEVEYLAEILEGSETHSCTKSAT